MPIPFSSHTDSVLERDAKVVGAETICATNKRLSRVLDTVKMRLWACKQNTLSGFGEL